MSGTIKAILFGCLGWLSFAQADSIKIAYVGGMTGNVSQASVKSLKALQLLTKHYNSQGGIRGKQIEVLPYDTHSSAVNNLSIIEKIKESGAVAIVGIHDSNDGLILSQLTEVNKIPLIVASATHPDITKNKKFVVRVCFNDDAQGVSIARFIKEKLHSSKIAMVVDVSNSFTEYLSKSFSRKYTSMGGEVVETFPIRTHDKRFADAVSKMKSLSALETLFLSASAMESSYLISQLMTEKINPIIIGNDGWQNNDFGRVIENLTHKKLSAFFTAHWFKELNSPVSKKFVSDFQREYSDSLNSFDADTVLTYDAGLVLYTALKRLNHYSPDTLMNEIRKTKVSGVTGEIIFDGNSDPHKEVIWLKISGGQVSQW